MASPSPPSNRAKDQARLDVGQARAPIFRRKPLDIIRVDLPLVLSLFCLLSVVLYPFRVPAGIVPDPASRNLPWLWLWYAPLQLGLILASLASTGAIVVGLSLFGPWGVLAVLGTVLLFMAQAHFLQPGLVFEYTHPSIDTAMKDQHADEEWLIINGVATADYRTPVRFLSKAFGRKITGVHNKTAGFVFDIIECIVQRDFTYITQDGTTTLYEKIKRALEDPDKKKVVLLAHSQGGIIASLITDFLLSDFPHELLRKLEIYTFASASNHWNNPIAADRLPVIPVIEHFANTKDIVARLGVLHWSATEQAGDTRFAGNVFERNLTGHLIIEHYFRYQLDPRLDPDPAARWPVNGTAGTPSRLWTYLGGN